MAKASRLWKDGHAAPGGTFPINTNGGGLSFNHSGMYGMQLLVEAYRQLSGTAEDGGFSGLPGKQTNARSCVVNGTGGSLSTTGTLVPRRRLALPLRAAATPGVVAAPGGRYPPERLTR